MVEVSARTGHVVPAGAGDLVRLGPIGAQFKLAAADTGGAFAMLEHPVMPRALVHPHVHSQEDEYSYVLAGTIGARVGDATYEELGPGSLLCKPRNVLHTFWNPTDTEARLLEIVVPAGLERFFADLGPLLEAGADVDALRVVTDRHGLGFDQAWVPELTERYGVSLDG